MSTVSAIGPSAGFGPTVTRDDRPVGVALAVAELVGVGVEADHGLGGVVAGLERVERAGEAAASAPTLSGSPGFQSLASTAKNGCGWNQSGPNRGSDRAGPRPGPSIT